MHRTTYDIKTLPHRYAQLVDILPPRPLHTESEYDDAVEMINALAGHKLNKDRRDYLDAISTFVEEYDDAHYPVEKRKPIQILRHLMEQHDMNASDLGRELGDRTLGPRILSGERKLNVRHIKALAEHFHVDPSLFLG